MESSFLSIGDLARASGLSASALRFYDRAGVLPPAYVDPATGYRWYAADQVRPARIVAALRRVAMPLAEISGVITGPPGTAVTLIEAHLCRLETGLADARLALSRVRTLVEPEEPSVPTATATVAATDLTAAIGAVRFAASTDPDLPGLTGVLVELGGGQVRLVATDRYRLAVAAAPAGGVPGAAVQAVAPPSWVDEVCTLLEDVGTATVTVGDGVLRVAAGGREVTGLPLPHDYPDYRRLLPGSAARRVPVDAPRLRDGLAAAADVAVLSIGPDDRLGIETGVPAPGAARVGVNPVFLLQALAAAGDRQLVLELDGPVTPLVLRPAGAGVADTFSLLMPVRLP